MAIELIGEKKYFDEVSANDGVWVLMLGMSVYFLGAKDGNSLPTWRSKILASKFSKELERSDLKPVFVDIALLRNGWLHSEEMMITEVGVDATIGLPMLSYTRAEFMEKLNA